jgi:hypothetical protein
VAVEQDVPEGVEGQRVVRVQEAPYDTTSCIEAGGVFQELFTGLGKGEDSAAKDASDGLACLRSIGVVSTDRVPPAPRCASPVVVGAGRRARVVALSPTHAAGRTVVPRVSVADF